MKKIFILIVTILLTAFVYLFIKQSRDVSDKVSNNFITENTAEKSEKTVDSEVNIPTHEFPLSSYVYDNFSKDGDKGILIVIENPFDVDVNAKLIQQIPNGVTVVDAANGVFFDNSLVWEMPIKSNDFVEIRLVVNISGYPGDKVLLKGAKLEYSNESGGDTYYAEDIEIAK